MTRDLAKKYFRTAYALGALGITPSMLEGAIAHTYKILDAIDQTLLTNGEPRLAQMVELANLSAIIGNVFRTGLANASNGRFAANGPHKYPDLLSKDSAYGDVEIKVALELNKPKGHLAKPGPHVTVRYVLCDEKGSFTKAVRGSAVYIWEVRVGNLAAEHFNLSNTPGDSGKTAVINKEGMIALEVAFCDLTRSPLSPKGRSYKALEKDFVEPIVTNGEG